MALSTPNTPPTYREAYARHQAQVHLVMLQRNGTVFVWAVVVTILLTLALFYILYLRRQLKRQQNNPPTQTTPPTEPPTQPDTANTFTRCYRRAYEALTEPEEVASHIDDPVLSGYLKQGGVKQKGELYEVTASLVRVLDGKEVESAAVRNALIRGFKKRRWPWPKSFDGLRQHILAHPPDSL